MLDGPEQELQRPEAIYKRRPAYTLAREERVVDFGAVRKRTLSERRKAPTTKAAISKPSPFPGSLPHPLQSPT